MNKTIIWVLHISHKHGDSYWTYEDEQDALDGLAGWARQWWEKEGLPQSQPADDGAAIEEYFAHVAGREHYNIEQTTLNAG